MQTATLNIECEYADKTTKKFSFGKFDENAPISAPSYVRNHINAINSNKSEIENIFLSSDGANFSQIISADLILEEITEINL